MPRGRLVWRVIAAEGEAASDLFVSKSAARAHAAWLGWDDAKLQRVRVI